MTKGTLTTLDAVAQLDRVAGQHEQTAATLRKLAKTLRALATWGNGLPDKRKPNKRKRMSKAARDKISKAAKARWAAKTRKFGKGQALSAPAPNGSEDDVATVAKPPSRLQDTLRSRA